LGFGLLFAAPIFKGGKLQAAIHASMTLSGLLCLVGVSGPASGDLRFQYPAILGYAFLFPFVCLLLAMLFRSDKSAGASTNHTRDQHKKHATRSGLSISCTERFILSASAAFGMGWPHDVESKVSYEARSSGLAKVFASFLTYSRSFVHSNS
jgi:hypothetical protein